MGVADDAVKVMHRKFTLFSAFIDCSPAVNDQEYIVRSAKLNTRF